VPRFGRGRPPKSFVGMLENRKQFLDGNRSVAENSAKGAEGNFSVKGNRDGETPRIGRMAKADVTAFLAHSNVAKLSQSGSSQRPKRRAASGSSGDDNASDQHIVRVRNFFAAAFHILEAKVYSLADIGKGLGHCFALRIAAGNGRANHDVTAVVLVGFEKDFEIAGGHCLW
jgi:hypothetical protein